MPPEDVASPVRARAGASVFHPERLVAVLGRFKVRYVVVGSLAARLHGSPWTTAVAELVPAHDAENLDALTTALKHVGARVYTPATPEGFDFEVSAATLAGADTWDLITSCGRLTLAFRPPGTAGYDGLAAAAVPFTIHSDAVLVARAEDLVAIGRAERERSGVMTTTIETLLLA